MKLNRPKRVSVPLPGNRAIVDSRHSLESMVDSIGTVRNCTRAQFLKIMLGGWGALPFLAAGALNDLRGDRVGWARLKTPSQWWKRHAETDQTLMRFLHANTSLNLDPVWHVADVEQLDQMCEFPLLFSQGVETVRSDSGRANITEYIRRGGFLLIDACIDDRVTPDPNVFFANQKATLAVVLPEAQVRPIPPDHAIYHCHFEIPEGKPPQTHTYWSKRIDERWTKHGLYQVMISNRMAGIITLHGLQCGWARVGQPPPEDHDEQCMRMLVNIYIYAMTQGR